MSIFTSKSGLLAASRSFIPIVINPYSSKAGQFSLICLQTSKAWDAGTPLFAKSGNISRCYSLPSFVSLLLVPSSPLVFTCTYTLSRVWRPTAAHALFKTSAFLVPSIVSTKNRFGIAVIPELISCLTRKIPFFYCFFLPYLLLSYTCCFEDVQ